MVFTVSFTNMVTNIIVVVCEAFKVLATYILDFSLKFIPIYVNRTPDDIAEPSFIPSNL